MLYLVGSKKEVPSRKKAGSLRPTVADRIVGGSNGAKFAFDWVNDMEFAKSRDKQAKAKAKEELEAV